MYKLTVEELRESGKVFTKDAEGRWRRGHFMYVASGRFYWPLDPRAEDVCIDDIAHHLAMQCRFNGATMNFYSVAEHSVHCSVLGPDDEAEERLFHDAPEYVIGDIIRPLKTDPSFAFFKEVEALNEKLIFGALGLRYPFPPSVKLADEAMAMLETDPKRGLIRNPVIGSLIDKNAVAPAHIELQCWQPALAKRMFLGRFAQIRNAKRAAKAA